MEKILYQTLLCTIVTDNNNNKLLNLNTMVTMEKQ